MNANTAFKHLLTITSISLFCFFLAACQVNDSRHKSQKSDQNISSNSESSTNMKQKKMPYSPDLYTTTLDNGLEVVVVPDHRLPLVHVGMAVKTGAISETPETDGLAHLYEHMTLNANEDFPTEEKIEEREKELGIVSNASTSSEVVRYYLSLPSDNLEEGVGMLQGVLRKPLFKKEELKGERNIVINEFNKRTGDPRRKLSRKIDRAMFYKYPWRRSTLGQKDVIKSARREDMVEFKDNYYRPNNSCFLAVGDITPEHGVRLAKKYFGDWEKKEDLKTFEDLPPHPELNNHKTVLVTSEDRQYATISIQQDGPSVLKNPKATYAADIWGTILGLSSSKFQNNLVDNGPFQSASMGYYTQKDGPQIYFSGNTSTKDLQKGLDAFHDEIQKFTDPDYFSKSDIQAAKNRLIVNRKFSVENGRDYLQTIGFWWAVAGLDYYQNYLENLRKISLQDVRNFCKNHVLEKNRVYGFLLPESEVKKENINKEKLESFLIGSSRDKKTEKDSNGRFDDEELNRSQSQRSTKNETPVSTGTGTSEDRTSEFSLKNGIRVIHRRVTENEVVSIQMFLNGGTMNSGDNPAGIEQFLLRSIQRGTESYPLEKLKKIMDREGINITSSSNYDYSRLQVKCLSEDVPLALQLVSSMVREPLLKKKQIEWVRKKMLLAVKQRMSDPSRHMWFVANEVLFDGHPYQNYPGGTTESLQKIQKKMLKSYHGQLFNTGKILFAVVGNIDKKSLKKRLNKQFAFVQSSEPVSYDVPPFNNPDKNEINIVNSGNLQTAFIVAKFPVIPMTSPEYPALNIGLEVLSDRIYEETRTKRGLTYGAYSGMAFYRQNWGYLYITTPKPNLGMSLIYKEIQKMKEEPVGKDEVRKTANILYTRQLLRRQSSSTQASLLGRAEIEGIGWEHHGEILKKMRNVTPGEIQEAIKHHVNSYHLGVIQGEQMEQKVNRELFVNPEKALEWLAEQEK